MANSTNGLFESLVVPAATNGKLTPRYRNRALDMCFNGYTASEGKLGQSMTINVPIVNESNVTNIGSGPIQPSDTQTTPVQITIGTKYSTSRTINSFDQIRTPLDLQEQYLGPIVEELLRRTNRAVTSLMNPTLFNAYAGITSSTANEFTRLDINKAWQNVVGTGGAPMDEQDLFFLTDHVAYGTTLSDPANSFINQYIVGEAAAIAAQQKGMSMPVFGAKFDFDQLVPTTTANKHGALLFNRYAIGLLPVIEAPQKETYIKQMVMYPTADKKFPVNLQFWHDPHAQGHVLHAFTMFGLAVINPAWGSYLETV